MVSIHRCLILECSHCLLQSLQRLRSKLQKTLATWKTHNSKHESRGFHIAWKERTHLELLSSVLDLKPDCSHERCPTQHTAHGLSSEHLGCLLPVPCLLFSFISLSGWHFCSLPTPATWPLNHRRCGRFPGEAGSLLGGRSLSFLLLESTEGRWVPNAQPQNPEGWVGLGVGEISLIWNPCVFSRKFYPYVSDSLTLNSSRCYLVELFEV